MSQSIQPPAEPVCLDHLIANTTNSAKPQVKTQALHTLLAVSSDPAVAHDVVERGGIEHLLALVDSSSPADVCVVTAVRLLRQGQTAIVKLSAADATLALLDGSSANAATALRMLVHETFLWLMGSIELATMKGLIVNLMKEFHRLNMPEATAAITWTLKSLTDTALLNSIKRGPAAFDMLRELFQNAWFIGTAIDGGVLVAYNGAIESALRDENAENQRPFLHCIGLVKCVADSEHCPKLASSGVAATLAALEYVSLVAATQSSISSVLDTIAKKANGQRDATNLASLQCLDRMSASPAARTRIATPTVVAQCVAALDSNQPEQSRTSLALLVNIFALGKPKEVGDEEELEEEEVADENVDNNDSPIANELLARDGVQRLSGLLSTSAPDDRLKVIKILSALVATNATCKREVSGSLEAFVKAAMNGTPAVKHAAALATVTMLKGSKQYATVALKLGVQEAFLSLLGSGVDSKTAKKLIIALLQSLLSLSTSETSHAVQSIAKSLIDAALTDLSRRGEGAYEVLHGLLLLPKFPEIVLGVGLLEACNRIVNHATQDNERMDTQSFHQALLLLTTVSATDERAKRVEQVCGATLVACLHVAASPARVKLVVLLGTAANNMDKVSELLASADLLSVLLEMMDAGVLQQAASASMLAALAQTTPGFLARLTVPKLLDACLSMMTDDDSSADIQLNAVKLLAQLVRDDAAGEIVASSEPLIGNTIAVMDEDGFDGMLYVLQIIAAVAGHSNGHACLVALGVDDIVREIHSQVVGEGEIDPDDEDEEWKEVVAAVVLVMEALRAGAN